MKKITALLLLMITLTSCESGEEKQTVTIDNRYSLDLPSFLAEGIDLNDDASLQYQNILREFYVIVIDEPKSDITAVIADNGLTGMYPTEFDAYTDLMLDGFDAALDITKESEVIDTTINQMPARLININATVEGLKAYYALALIEGKNNYYQVLSWTVDSKEAEHKDLMKQIIYSFKEVEKRSKSVAE